MMLLLFLDQLLKVKLVMLMATLEFLEEVGDPATGKPIGETKANLASAVAGETHEYTLICIQVWQKLLEKKVLKK